VDTIGPKFAYGLVTMYRLLSSGGAWVVALAGILAARVQAAARVSPPVASESQSEAVGGMAAAEISPLFFMPELELAEAEPPAMERGMTVFPAVRFFNLRTQEGVEVRLYDETGAVDEEEAAKLDELCADERNPDHPLSVTMDRRTLQLLFRAAYHFRAWQVDIVSGYRSPKVRHEGMHGKGRAIDFRLRGTSPWVVARYLRSQPRAGVGLYTHPKTQFVHLDDRDDSFHWVDRSPPGRRWHEVALSMKGLPERDATYQPLDDWPEGSHPLFLDQLSAATTPPSDPGAEPDMDRGTP
jgi:uncharacterized protein YcbK (DUF882 family)